MLFRSPFLYRPSLALWLKGTVIQEEKGPKLVAQEIGTLENALPKWPDKIDLRLQTMSATREQLLALKEILSRHPGPVPVFLHLLAPHNGDAVLALPPELHLTPSPQLA